MIRFKRKIVSVQVVVLLLSLVLSSCGPSGSMKEVKLLAGASTVNFSTHVLTSEELGAASLIDAVYTGDGYLVIAGKDTNTLERELVTLDNSLKEIDRRSADLETEAIVVDAAGIGRLMTAQESAVTNPFTIGRSTWGFAADGAVYVYSSTSLTRDGADIALPEEKNTVTYIRGVVTIGGITYAVMEQKNTRTTPYTWKSTWLCPVTADTTQLEKLGKSLPFEVSACASDGETGWIISGSTLYRTDGIEVKPYADLAAAGVNTDQVRKLMITDDGFLILSQNELVLLSEGESAATPVEKETIRVASLSATYSSAVAAFNRENERYTVEVTTYGGDISQLNLALANGEADMVISSEYTAIWNYAKRGLLVPLEELTPGLFEDGVLVESVVNAMRIDEACYFLPPTFDMMMFSMPKDDARDFKDIYDFMDFVEANFTLNFQDPGTALFYILKVYGDVWIDLDTGEAYFNTAGFKRLIEFCNAFEFENLEDQFVPLLGVNLGNLDETSYYPVAIPSEKSGGVALSNYSYIGVTAGGNTAGAAEFLSYLMLEGQFDSVEANNDMPTSVTRLSQYLATRKSPLGNSLWYSDSEKEIILELIPRANHVNQLSWYLAQHVVQEEAEVYFNGDCTLDEAVERIQSRVSLYLAELG